MGDARALWTECSRLLQEEVGDGVWMSTFQGTEPVSLDGDHLVISVPSAFSTTRIDGMYRPQVQDALRAASGVEISFTVETRPAFQRYVERLQARPAAVRAREIDDALVPAQPQPA